jgi:very-short-patch-repair endonuclease
MFKHRIILKPAARKLRSNMTECEQLIWARISKKQLCGIRFHRQRVLGPFIVDFYAPSIKLVLEIDGIQHHEAEHLAQDKFRDQYFEAQGIKVLRLDNHQVKYHLEQSIEIICHTILGREYLKKS